MQTALPVVDLRDEPAALRQRLGPVAHEVGFFYPTGHGVPEDLIARLLAEFAARARGVTDDPTNDRIYPAYGRNAWKSRIRAHPDVAAAHHYM